MTVVPDKQQTIIGAISAEERLDAILTCVCIVQKVHCANEIDILNKKRSRLKGAVAKLNPFLDQSGLLRVRGRLRNSQ